ncbi:TRM11 family SAM-dependent methyltransferase [Methanolobus bombayensis]|uniref:TRM11 family SAM-dependent methyltransferase n=1 Tax=Methanolobus bombayensis TaxID=38023 RepID=UPI001AE89DEC|nr:TRM11 family methyltransferase [Methanolobus bombayensis]MBP1907818.1 tRNA (guanine10-N2)-dimethyltransferase [Methanolobus bombayensis]
MLYAFELSGEHVVLPVKEVYACLSMEGLTYREHASYDQCLIVDIDGEDVEAKLQFIAGRLSMSHHILKVVGICDVETDRIIEMCDRSDISEHLSEGQTYVVRAKRAKHHGDVNREFIEGRLGGSIYRKGFRANLKEPDVTFRFIMTNKAVLGSVVATVDRGDYEHRAPHKKPFFYPGVLMPRVARALVNISRIRSDEVLFDPFSGTAGILVEGGLVGAHVIGIEVRHKISHGAKMNLDEYDAHYSLLVGDACRVPLKDSSIDAIVTDPPYGRSAAIKAESLHHLYSDSFAEMYRVLKTGKLAVVVSEMKVAEFAEKAGFSVIDVFTQKVHRSLTRIFTVLYKE